MSRALIGWREWAGLPDLGIDRIGAKIDTGAQSAALHALQIEPMEIDGSPYVSFIAPIFLDGRMREIRCCEALADKRIIRSSNGGEETRYVIRTALRLGVHEEMIELSLTDRSGMENPLLIGRVALGGRFLIDPQASYIAGSESL